MSDPPQPPPAKPKPGSLRDRIAAFEKPAPSSSAPKPPPVRPKPGGIAWKPAPPSPPSIATENTEHEEKKPGGMSASDAKESIGKGGSLKERMAALQGKGAFGGGITPGPPPVGPKPVKRPPLVVPPPPKEESEESVAELDEDQSRDEQTRDQPAESEARDDTNVARTVPKDDAPKEEKDAPVEEEEDEEAKERERREAIAARMARLGGARVGLVPPMFGKRPEVKEKPEVTPPKETGPVIASEKAPVLLEERVLEPLPLSDGSTPQPKVESPPEVNETNSDVLRIVADKEVAAEDFESHPAPDATSSQSSHLSSRSLPMSIPIPAAPRRAGPPRKKSTRSLKGEAKVQDQETPEVPLVPAVAPAEAPAVVEVPGSSPTVQHEAFLAAEQRPGSEHNFSVKNDSAGSHEVVIDQGPNTLAEAGEHVRVPASSEVVDEGESVPRVRESSEESSEVVTGMAGGWRTDESQIPELEPETHTPTVELITTQEMQNINETHDFEEPSSLLVNEQDPYAPTELGTNAKHKQHVDVDTRASNSSKLSLGTRTIASTVVAPVHEPVEMVAEGRESAAIQDRRESEPQVAVVVEEQAEDEEADRKKRIAERLAKMGGRNPFSAGPFGVAGPPRRAGGDEPHEPVKDISSHTESVVDEQTYADVTREGRALAEVVTQIQNHEADGQEPRVSSVAEEHGSALTALEESFEETEAIEPEPNLYLKELTTALQPEVDDYLETSSKEQEGVHFGEEGDEMAPPRITRAIPPLPPSQSFETPPEPILQRRVISPATREISPLTADDEINVPTPRSVSPDQLHTLPSDLTPVSIPSVRSVRKDSQRNSSPSPTSMRSRHSPSRAAPSTSSTTDSTDLRSPSSESSRRSLSPPPRTVSALPSDDNHQVMESSPTSLRKAIPPPARPPVPPTARSSSPEIPSTKLRQASVRRSIPPPPSPSSSQVNERVVSPPPRPVPLQPVEEVIPAAIRRALSNDASEPSETLTQPRTATPEIQVAPRDSVEQEVLAESEADPIDPAFYSPPRSPAASHEQYLPSFKTSSREPSEGNAEEDPAQSRRRTIAERMAKLGGIRFGAPPIPHKPSVPQPESPSKKEVDPEGGEQELDAKDSTKQADVLGSEEPDSEEAERVRRQAIATRLAGLGGMRFGMLPQMSSSTKARAGSDHNAPQATEHVSVPPQQPVQLVPPSSTEPAASETDLDSVSDEGVKVEAGSELSMEEVNPEDAVEAVEEIPPPVPSRFSRPSHPPSSDIPPPLPGGRRPPVPTSPPSRPPLPKTESMRSESFRKASGSSGFHISPTSDFVMVDENQEVPPPPRSRPLRPPPGPSKDLDSSPWELPEIPRGSFDVNVPSDLRTDTSISLEDSTTYPPPATPQVLASPVEPTPTPAPAVRADVQLSADDLLQLWGAVGTVVHASASALFDKSKKTVVGDGTSHGFVYAALLQVPQASRASYGHLIYSQNGNSVLRRSSNIMPGDIIQLTEAKLKGHKGLQSYHQTAGTAQEPLVGIISEFDAKKSKVKVFQANQHVGSQTVESASYRLDDLKSGSVKVFRVASA